MNNNADLRPGWHQHKNGGGWVEDGATVSEAAYIGVDAVVHKRATVGKSASIHGGTFHGGLFHGGRFYGGKFHGGRFLSGVFYDGEFHGGEFHGGKFSDGEFHGGVFHGGKFHGGEFRDGWIRSGTFEYGCLVASTRDVLTLSPVGSEDQEVTLTRRVGGGHVLTIGCWQGGTVDELADEVQRRCPDHADEYDLIEQLLRKRIAEWEARDV